MKALKAHEVKFSTVEIASDHVFDDRRIALETVVLDWLSLLGGPVTPAAQP